MTSSIQILIVDDEPYITRSLSYVFEREGFSVAIARNGNEGVIKARELFPKVIFLDIMMPGKNGFEVCTFIKNDPSLQNIYVIMLTAKGQEQDKHMSLTCGANEYMTKPFSPKKIVKRVREILEQFPT